MRSCDSCYVIDFFACVIFCISSSLYRPASVECIVFCTCSDRCAVLDAMVWPVSCFLTVLFRSAFACAALHDIRRGYNIPPL